MNWSYITGFFDGEGHISLNEKRLDRGIQVVFCQATKNERVLIEIQNFLISQCIKAPIYRHEAKNHTAMTTIQICDYPSVIKCLKRMLQYLIVKKLVAIKAIELTRTNIIRMKKNKNRLKLAIRFWKTGMGHHKISKMTGVDGHTLKREFERLGFKARPIGTNQYNLKQTPPPIGVKP